MKECELLPADNWILGVLNETMADAIKGYNDLDFNKPAVKIRTFTWETFASHYMEMAKARAYNKNNIFSTKQQKGAWYTLNKCLESMLRILAPICPFITDEIHRRIYSPDKSIHLQDLPEPLSGLESHYGNLTPIITAVNGAIWKTKKDAKLPLNATIRNMHLPQVLEPFREDLKTMHNVENLSFERPQKATLNKYTSLEISQDKQENTIYIQLNE
jgi:valyl-tRNA synthetase